MANYVLTCGSTTDLTQSILKARNVPCISYHYELDNVEYVDDMWEEKDPHDFYTAMEEGAMTHTSQINMASYAAFWEPFLEQGQDVIHLALSSGITGTVNSARLAADSVMAKYPDRRVLVVDSLGASAGSGLLLCAMADKRDAGYSIDELYDWTENNKLRVQHWFFSTDISFYIRGGRIGKTAGFIGKLLNICPLMNMDSEGRLIPREKIRTKKKVIREIVNRMVELAENGVCYDEKCFISHSDCLEDAEEVARLVEATFPNLNGDVQITNIGPTIGSHTGPGTVAMFFWGEKRMD